MKSGIVYESIQHERTGRHWLPPATFVPGTLVEIELGDGGYWSNIALCDDACEDSFYDIEEEYAFDFTVALCSSEVTQLSHSVICLATDGDDNNDGYAPDGVGIAAAADGVDPGGSHNAVWCVTNGDDVDDDCVHDGVGTAVGDCACPGDGPECSRHHDGDYILDDVDIIVPDVDSGVDPGDEGIDPGVDPGDEDAYAKRYATHCCVPRKHISGANFWPTRWADLSDSEPDTGDDGGNHECLPEPDSKAV